MNEYYNNLWGKEDAPSMLYFLVAQDTIERLDTLILELRHLQVSIISHLREPRLYKILREEEKYLWGGCNEYTWKSFLEVDHIRPEKFAAEKVLLFPSVRRRDLGENQSDNESNDKEEKEDIKKIILDIWYCRGWSSSQKQNYHVLRTAQKIKRQIFSDKLYLIKYAHKYGVLDFRNTKGKARFLVLRAGVHKRIRGYIDRIRDLKNIFNDFMDGGRQDHPRPSVMRRREVGIYKDFLSDRSRDVRRDMHMLLDKLNVPVQKNVGVILHRWRHDSTSRTASFLDEVDSYRFLIGEQGKEVEVDFVNSSYFMPERPDLQSVIAHEVAHRVLHARFDDFSFFGLRNRMDAFSNLIFDIQDAAETFFSVAKINIPSRILRYFYKELACDFLASSLEGFSFVYALFLENIGHGLDSLLEVENGAIDLSMIDHIESLKPSSLHHRLFITRILLNCKWVMAIHHEEPCKLDIQLITGIEEICFELEAYLNSTLHNITRADVENWSILSGRLFEIVSESNLCKDVKKWRESRRKDTNDDNQRLYWPVSNWPIPNEARKLLYDIQLALKNDRPKENHIRPLTFRIGHEAKFKRDFLDLYGVGPFENIETPPYALYRHLYDIPWQCAVMRSIDLFAIRKVDKANYGLKEVIRDIHYDFALGRELFSIGLEYYMWYTEPANLQLITIVNLLQALQGKDELDKDVFNWLYGKEGWLGKEGSTDEYGLSQKINEFIEKISEKTKNLKKELVAESINDLKKGLAKTTSAQVISASFSRIKESNFPKKEGEYLYRWIEVVAGLKLNILSKKLKEYACTRLVPIDNFLATRNTSITEKDISFFDNIKLSLLPLSREENSETFRSIDYYMVGRHTFSGAYENISERSSDNEHLRISDIQKDSLREHKVNDYSIPYLQNLIPVLGRYDVMTLYKTKPLCRCKLPIFDTKEHKRIERFPLYSSRREYATKLSFSKYDNKNSTKMIFGIIVVVLQKKAYRLGFLNRLFNSEEHNVVNDIAAKRKRIEKAIYLDQMKGVLDEDYGLLIDGWGDLMLVFTDPKRLDSNNSNLSKLKKEQVEKARIIFKLQELLFKDFMVDSLETIFTPEALNSIWGEKGFEIRVETRLIEDRLLSNSNDKYTNSIKKKIAAYQNGKGGCDEKEKLDIQFSASKVAGRMDYSFNILHHSHPQEIDGGAMDYAFILNDVFNHEVVETIETKLNSHDIKVLEDINKASLLTFRE